MTDQVPEPPETCPKCGANNCGDYLTFPRFKQYMCGSRIGGSALDQKLDQSESCRIRELEQQLATREAKRTDEICPICCTAIWTNEDRIIDRQYGDETPRHLVCAITKERDDAKQQLAEVTAELQCLRRSSREHHSCLSDIIRRFGVARNPTEVRQELEREIQTYERRLGSQILG